MSQLTGWNKNKLTDTFLKKVKTLPLLTDWLNFESMPVTSFEENI